MPPKKQKTGSKNIASFFKKVDRGSNSLNIMETQPGGAAGPRPGEAEHSRPGGAERSLPGEAKHSRAGEAKHSRPGEATGSRTFTRSQVRGNEENINYSTDGHLHNFTVRFLPTDREEYTINCNQPGTVLEAIKSSKTYEELKFKDKNIVIQLGKEDRASTVATHFPCSFISEGESLFISCESEKVEAAQDEHYKTVHSRDKYSVFYIDTDGGLYTKTKKLFRSSAVKQFKYLCVYGEKGMTVEEALQRDGRFIENLSNFKLSHNDTPDCFTKSTATVDNLDGKKLKIRLPRITRSKKNLQENLGTSDNSHQRRERGTIIQQNRLVSTSKTDVATTSVSDILKQRGTSVRTASANKDNNLNNEEIYKKLCEQFPGLKEHMKKRFPDNSYQEALDLRKEDFGKIQHSFSEVHRVRKLFKLGESVCKVVVEDVQQGTGFVLFDNFILTNAHILKGYVEGGKLKEGIQIYAFFNYEAPEPHTQCYYFQLAHGDIYYSEGELDYVILEINPEGFKLNPKTPTKQIKVPPGLLKRFGPIPLNGEACIIGHPAGDLKKMDPICIIKKEQREQAVTSNLENYKNWLFTLHTINHTITNDPLADVLVTYNTFMYHGSSGSPVFDAHERVFGLHSGGFYYDYPIKDESVIEFAHPLLIIFQDFVSKLKESGYEDLLKRVEEEAKGNPHLKKVLNATSTNDLADPDKPMITQ